MVSRHPKQIAFVVPAFSMGGLETSLLRIGQHLRAAGHQVSVITTESRGNWFERIEGSGFQSHAIEGLSRWNFIAHAFKVGRHLDHAGYDVVFIAFDRYAQASLCLLPDKTAVIPMLRNDHEDVYQIGLANEHRWNVAIGNSPRICQVASTRRPDKHVALMPNGVNCPDRLPEARWTTPTCIEALFVGRLVHESKRVLLLPPILEACLAKGLNIHLTIAGDGHDRADLAASFEERGLTKRVTLLGYVAPADLAQLYQRAHLFFFLSAYEGLPNVLLECQAHGCIPIATSLEGITDYVIRQGVTGRVVDADALDEFATAVLETCADTTAAAMMSLEAHQWIQTQFSTALESTRILTLLDDVFSNKHPLSRPRRARMIDITLFPPSYVYRRLLRPGLATVYRAMKRLIGSLRPSARAC